jgi:hypothetical protein
MDTSEKKFWEEDINKGIREFLFSIGQPLVYRKNGKLIAEYPDGRIKTV